MNRQPATVQVVEVDLWVPETLSPHAAWAYSWRRPPSLSCRTTWISASTGSGIAERTGVVQYPTRPVPLKWDSYTDRTLRMSAASMMNIHRGTRSARCLTSVP
jgi:hypothetical protein